MVLQKLLGERVHQQSYNYQSTGAIVAQMLWGITKCFMIEFKIRPKEGTHALYYKSGQVTMVGELTGPSIELTIILLNEDINMSSKFVSLCLSISVTLLRETSLCSGLLIQRHTSSQSA